MTLAEFKNIKPIKFGNVTIGATYEWKLQPWMLVIMVGFKMQPTDKAEENFSNENEMRMYIANSILGKRILTKNAERIVPPGWLWHGMRYSMEHQPQQFSYGRNTSFQVEFYVIAPEQIGKSEDKKALEIGFKQIAKKLANLPNFESDHLFKFTQSVSVK